jgi:hypothetical protein
VSAELDGLVEHWTLFDADHELVARLSANDRTRPPRSKAVIVPAGRLPGHGRGRTPVSHHGAKPLRE